MSAVDNIGERLQNAFTPTSNGVVGVVDELLSVCHDDGRRLDWRSHKCQVQILGVEPRKLIDVPMPIAAFRAILARLAALCNEANPGSVSPYGGQGELTIRTGRPSTFRVALINTPNEQRGEVRRVAECDRHG